MNLQETVQRLWLSPRVRHRLPGRLRIHLPYLAHCGDEVRPIIALVERLLMVPDEITAVEASPVTGNVLIRYDDDRVSEAEVRGFVTGVFQLYLRNREALHEVGLARLPEIAEQLEATVRAALRRRLTIDTHTSIADDIVA